MESKTGETKTTVLVVDDQEYSIKIILGFLKDTTYNFHTARDGNEAWKILTESPNIYSAVLLDRLMPGLDGLGVLENMKAHQDLKQEPVIFQTSLTEEHEIIEGINAGAYHYLAKPLKKKILKAVVKSAVSDYEHHNTLSRQAREMEDAITFMESGRFSFRTLAEGHKLSTLIGGIFGESDQAIVGLWELIANAVEHGNLGITYDEKSKLNEDEQLEAEIERRFLLPEYANKKVTFEIEQTGDEIRFTIQDQGKGFDWESYMDFSPDRA
ncbi:MAG: response regulator, partial [bacterium]|nr:response regulator [bacterium]